MESHKSYTMAARSITDDASIHEVGGHYNHVAVEVLLFETCDVQACVDLKCHLLE
jgi:hypothetical protein